MFFLAIQCKFVNEIRQQPHMHIYETTERDDELGEILLKTNCRARHIIMRATDRGITITLPPGITPRQGLECLQDNLEKMKRIKALRQKKTTFIDFDYQLRTDVMQISIEKSPNTCFYCRGHEGSITLFCPVDTAFEKYQRWLHKTILEELKEQAKVILKRRTRQLAEQFGFKFSQIRIQTAHTRWGSCSATNSINLSVFLMTLPQQLIDYVILHELCHTIHHNHSPRFWAKMDEVTEAKAQELRRELKKYDTRI